MIKKTLVMLVLPAMLSGCATVFDPNGASSNFTCREPNNPDAAEEGVTCKTPFAVYKSTNDDPPLRESDLPVGVSLTDVYGPSGQKANGQANTPPGLAHGQSYALPGNLGSQGQPQFARPVREPAQVMRIWIAPWVDKKDDLHFPTHIFTEIQARRWAFGSEEFSSKGLIAPTKQLADVPAGPVAKPASSAPGSPAGQLATEMPSLKR